MSDDRPVAATPRMRVQAAREQGLPRSSILCTAALLMAGVIGTGVFGPTMWQAWHEAAIAAWNVSVETPSRVPVDAGEYPWLVKLAVLFLVRALALWLVALASCCAQGGVVWRTSALAPDFSRLHVKSPLRSLTFSAVGRYLLSFGGSMVITVVGGLWIYRHGGDLLGRDGTPTGDVLRRSSEVWEVGSHWATWLIAILGLVGLVDYAILRWSWLRGMKLTDAQWRETMRQLEGNPAVKRAQRRVGRQGRVARE